MVILGFRSSLKAISPMKEKRGGSTVAGKGGVVRGDTEFISDEQEQLEQEMLQKITSQVERYLPWQGLSSMWDSSV
ncbi:unnamed protein product [Nippostrongylus brasiliensis]|uniref:DTNA n=1 Tax=Nippostrongylus brasiliensis TaxID=27835 RepID=A0A0N4YTY4_NIPBR|nr:unnamed protein product [Nippostrongylus brasiliensis]